MYVTKANFQVKSAFFSYDNIVYTEKNKGNSYLLIIIVEKLDLKIRNVKNYV